MGTPPEGDDLELTPGSRPRSCGPEKLAIDGEQQLAMLRSIRDDGEAIASTCADESAAERKERARSGEDDHDVQAAHLAELVIGLSGRDHLADLVQHRDGALRERA